VSPADDARRDVVVIGGSAGAVDALQMLVGDLPADLPAAVAVVVHGRATRGHNLPRLLAGRSGLPVTSAHDGEPLERRHVYVAPPGRHLLIQGDMLRLSYAAEENRTRPAIDPLFRTAAEAYGSRVIGVILSGNLDDGSAGLLAVRQAGGITLVQDPAEARFPEMPASAIEFALPDAVLPVAQLAARIVHAVSDLIGTGPSVSMVADEAGPSGKESEPELISALTCPQCNGALWVRDLDGLLQYRCRIGHILSQATMVSEQARMVEDALWAAARALEEQCALANRIAERFEGRGDAAAGARHRRQAVVAARRATTLRSTLLTDDGTEPPS
jgi:two-component system chemotaxis response regulator CheB